MSKSRAEKAYVNYTLNNASPLEEAFLAHHGILGMKWGIRRFQNKDGTRTAAGKKRYSSINNEEIENAKSPLYKSLEERGYKIDNYGNHVKDINSPNDSVKKLVISADTESSFGLKLSDKDYTDLLDDIEKNYNQIQIKMSQEIANWAFSEGNEPLVYQDSSMSLKEQRQDFISRLGTQMYDFEKRLENPGFAYIRLMADGYGEFGIDDGGAYGDHWLTTELDWKKWKDTKIRHVAVEG